MEGKGDLRCSCKRDLSTPHWEPGSGVAPQSCSKLKHDSRDLVSFCQPDTESGPSEGEGIILDKGAPLAEGNYWIGMQKSTIGSQSSSSWGNKS